MFYVKSDSAAVRRAVFADTIETHGFGIKKETWDLIEKAYKEKGIIILTDPDFSGEEIRRKLSERFPNAKQAHIIQNDATKEGDIGVENAAAGVIREALEKSKAEYEGYKEIFTYEDMRGLGLTGDEYASTLRAATGKILGIGYGNTGSFLNKLNKYGITMEELNEAIFAVRGSGAPKKAQL
jgi:ribonuclease M5